MRVYGEMSTGKWWWSVQVCMNHDVYAFLVLMLPSAVPRVTQTRCNCIAHPHLIEQDTTHTLLIEEHLSNLLDNWQHPQGCS